MAERHAPAGDALNWWQTRGFVLAVTLLAAVPLLWPEIPPLVDLPGHMGRYRVQLDGDLYPWFGEWYNFEWQLMGNLGVDLLVIPLTRLFGLELAVKLAVLAIPPLTVAGLLWIAREVHGRIPATALFALPLAYSYPFHFGFVNFALSMALALCAFAWWLRLARLGRLRFRSVVFVPISVIIWVTHTFGWGVLGVLAFSAELIRQHDVCRREGGLRETFVGNWIVPWIRAGLQCLVLALPMLLMLVWRSGDHVGGTTGDWFNWRAKMQWITMILRDRWQLFDIASLGILFLILFKGVRDPNIGYSRNLLMSALFLVAVYVLLPRIVFGSAYADMRLAPYMLAIGVIALRPKPGLSIRGAALLAAAGLAFFGARIAATTVSFAMYDRVYDRELAALDALPQGARLISFVGNECVNPWAMSRVEHLPAMALVRKQAFTNDQWSMAGGQLLTVRRPEARGFNHDPSQIVTQRKCRGQLWRPVDRALTLLPRDAYDWVWMIQPPRYDAGLTRGLSEQWRNGTSVLYRIESREPPEPVTNPPS